MRIKPILLGLILICSFFILPVMAAEDGELLKVYDKDGNVVDNAGRRAGSDKKANTIDPTDNKKSDTDEFEIDDVWGIKKSDEGWSDLVDINSLGGVYMGITPFRNASLISISIMGGSALTFIIVGIFGLLIWAGIGAAHPNIKKGWDMIRGAQGKIAAIGVVFALAFFMIILIFFTLSIFGKVIIMMA